MQTDVLVFPESSQLGRVFGRLLVHVSGRCYFELYEDTASGDDPVRALFIPPESHSGRRGPLHFEPNERLELRGGGTILPGAVVLPRMHLQVGLVATPSGRSHSALGSSA